jgi:hypothetical protein
MSNLDKSSLSYLGEEYQYKLVKEFIEDKNCFKDLAPIIDQNMFTGQYLRMLVGTMLEYLSKHGDVPSYSSIGIDLRQKAHTQADIEIIDAVINKIRNMSSEGSGQTRELATKFFKQQNIIKAANEMLRLAGNGDLDNYDRCEQLLRDALNTGNHEDYEESRLFDGLDETLSDDFRTVIPTGIGKIDETLNGGIGKGELGVILGPSSFGKVQPYDAKIVTPDGIVEMCNIKVGSLVIGADGKTHKVTGVFPHKDWDFYRVKFSDGVSTECGMEHLWNVNSFEQRSVGDNSFKTLSLREIVDSGLCADCGDYNFKVPITKAVEFNDISVDVEPYKFGLELAEKDVCGIPHEYLYNSLNNRIKLLCGLVDGGGCCSYDGYYAYSTKHVMMANDIRTLILSLGGSVEVKSDNDKFVLRFILGHNYIGLMPLSCNQLTLSRYIDSVEYSRKCDGQCIKVDAEDELYLTDDFIVTHNTSLTTSMALHAAGYRSEQNNNNGFKVMQIVFEDRIKQIQRKHFSKITQVEACNLSKSEYKEHVMEILNNYEDKELIQDNLRIIRLKSGEKSVDFIIELIKKHINMGFRPDLVIIDYFECIKLTGQSTMSKWDKESSIMRKIEACANELNIGFWVPVQGNKESINTDLVTMDNGGGSIGKIQIAHIIMSITRSLEDIASNIATIAILKNRAGSSGIVIDGASFNNGTCTISTDNVAEFENTVDFGKKKEMKKFDEDNELTAAIFKSTKR